MVTQSLWHATAIEPRVGEIYYNFFPSTLEDNIGGYQCTTDAPVMTELLVSPQISLKTGNQARELPKRGPGRGTPISPIRKGYWGLDN